MGLGRNKCQDSWLRTKCPMKRSMSMEEGGGWSGPSRDRSAYASCLPPRSLEAGHSKDES